MVFKTISFGRSDNPPGARRHPRKSTVRQDRAPTAQRVWVRRTSSSQTPAGAAPIMAITAIQMKFGNKFVYYEGGRD